MKNAPIFRPGACGDGFAALALRSLLRSGVFVGLAWYRFAEGEALRCGFLFAFEPVEDCLSALLLVFLDDRLDPPVCDQVVFVALHLPRATARVSQLSLYLGQCYVVTATTGTL